MNRIGRLFVPMLVLAAGCTARPVPPPPPPDPPPFAACTELAAPPAAAPAGRPPGGGQPLPALRLRCFNGGEQWPLAGLRGPAVVNLWASWCGPCRDELPALQRYAARAAGTVHVVGVVTDDDPRVAAELASDLGVSFPALDDPEQQLLRAVGRPFLPVTVLVDRDGRVRHVYAATALDDSSLAALVERHLGVRVGA